jgi:hypothetical protein
MNLTRLSAVLLAVALPFATTGVAAADPDTSLTLTVAAPEGARESVELECEPMGGSHPNPLRACMELRMADGDFERLPGRPDITNCTMEYRPVTAVAEGTWDGERVAWKREFSNACTLHTVTGSIFQF